MRSPPRWLMCLGPSAVTISSELPVMDVVTRWRAAGEEPLYRLVPAVGDGDAAVIHEPSRSPRAVWDPATATLRVFADTDMLSPPDLLYLAGLVLESRLQQRGYLTLHAAAVAAGDRAVLLLGPAGAGKTTTALRLCREHGARLLGNDLVVVGGEPAAPRAWTGTRFLRLRHASVSRAAPDLLRLFPGRVADPWRAKIVVPASEVGVDVCRGPTSVAAVVFVHVDAGYLKLVDAPGDTLVHRLNLHENALRYIRGGSTPWLVGDARRFGPFVPPLDDERAHAARTATLEALLARSRYLAGPVDAVAAHAAQLMANGVSHGRVPVARRMP